MVFRTLAIAFGALALISLLAATQNRATRGVLLWSAVSAAFAAASAYYRVFWPTALTGLMVFWALFAATDVLASGWRHRVGVTLYVALGTAMALYPTVHDEILCSSKGDGAALRETCPARLRGLSSEERDTYNKAAESGDRGFTAFLLQNIPFRMVRGLDLAGGLRLVYSVQVDEAIRDKRDRAYDGLRAGLTKLFGFSAAENPTVAEMKKLVEKAKLTKPRDKADTIVLTLEDPNDAGKVLDPAFLASYQRDLAYSPGVDKKTITFRIRNEIGSDIRSKAVQQAKETIARRIDGMGVKEVSPSVRDEDVIVEVPGNQEKEFDRIREIISETARLEFKLLDDEVDFFAPFVNQTEGLPRGLRFEQENAPVGKTESGSTRTKPSFYARIARLDGESMEECLKRFRTWAGTLPVDEDHEIGFHKIVDVDEDTEQFAEVGWRTYFLKAKAELTGDMVSDAQAQPDRSESGLGGWYVQMSLRSDGAERFEEITGANVKKRFAIILDNKVESAPVINEAIGGGVARISMGSGNLQQQRDDATKLELVLRSGALPAPIALSNEQRIGALLGDDAIKDGLTGAALGAVLVLAFMLYNYRSAGLIANVAVVFNMFIQLAILAMFNASMTLPGICGLALTIGASVDANVLINERINEEVRAGKSARSAVAIGYEKAFSAILDGHVVMFIAGLILMQYGTGPIKGFAVTLIVGLLTNLYTGVFVTKILFDWMVRGRGAAKVSVG
ncbi:MAG: protein translocase subunit SecD [Deltaproteobacteria bacterium]|nr:protein translocase subunit SecD [Deltaproteobacteria bacterium]